MLVTPSAALARGKYVAYIALASIDGSTCSKYERWGVTAIPPLTREPPPTPRPW